MIIDSKLATKGPVEDGRHKRVQLGGGLRLVALERINLSLKSFPVSDYAALKF